MWSVRILVCSQNLPLMCRSLQKILMLILIQSHSWSLCVNSSIFTFSWTTFVMKYIFYTFVSLTADEKVPKWWNTMCQSSFLAAVFLRNEWGPHWGGREKKQSSSWNSCGAWPAVPAIRSRILDLVQIWTKPGELYRKGPEINTQCVLLWIRGFLAWTPQIKAPFMKALCKFVCLYVW